LWQPAGVQADRPKERTMSIRHLATRLSVAGLVGLALHTAAVAGGSCTIYQHRDYGGSAYRLGHLDRMKMVHGESLGCTTNGHGGGCESVLYEPSWNDQVSSFKVAPGCTITLWQHVNEGGARFRTYKSYRYVGSGWNDEASEALCTCR
jgi:syncollin